MFEYLYEQESQIPADHKPFYENRDGGWYLKVNGVVAKEKLDKFRNNNTELMEEVKKLKEDLKPFDGVDVNLYHELKAKEQDLKDDKLVKKGDVEQIRERATAAIKEDHARQIKAKDDIIAEKDNKLAQLSGSLKKITIDNALLSEANQRGLKKGADRFLLATAERFWDLDADSKPVVKDDNGKIRYGKNGDEMRPAEWLDEIQSQHSYLFEGNTGSGTPGGETGRPSTAGGMGGGMPAGYNPWRPETRNITKQMEVFAKDPAEARRLCLAAGQIWNAPAGPPVAHRAT
jgi:hypothetical protein